MMTNPVQSTSGDFERIDTARANAYARTALLEPANAAPDSTKSAPAAPDEKNRAEASNGPRRVKDYLLRFQVDDDTNEITVLIIDPSSKKIVRTVPPEKLGEMPAGELLEIFA